ncbi:MAG: META domain-containing protein [Cryomorphaceae bacterium]|nr:META domain-containing protein [Cryomorphaceae bacterium]
MLNRAFLISLVFIVALSCKTKNVAETSDEDQAASADFVFVDPLPENPQHRQSVMQLQSNHVLTLENQELGMALILDQADHQIEEDLFQAQFKAAIGESIVRFNGEMRKEKDRQNRTAFIGDDDQYRMLIIHFADSLKADEPSSQPVGDLAMRQGDNDSLSYFDVKLIKKNTTDTTHLAFWGNFYYDHRLHGHWVLSEVNGFDDIMPEVYGSQLPSMTFRLDSMQVQGFAGCNRFFGPFKQIGFKIDMSSYAMTKMFCQDKPDIISHLQKAMQYRLEGNRLIFDFPMGNDIVFEKRSN